MCDTMGMVNNKQALFGKNSDRRPTEPQVTEWRPAALHSEKTVKCTYVEVDQVEHTHGTLLSRPVWLWGAEIGINDQGVVIGNEALFTTNDYAKTGLTGMDLLRMGLERSDSARGALETIIALLERYGQGGNCGYGFELYYDNAFLIMDKKDVYVLETMGKQWAYKKFDRITISNCILLGDDADAYSGERIDFRRFAHPEQEPLFGGKERRCLSAHVLENTPGLAGIFKALRSHQPDFKLPVKEKSSRNVCVHAAQEGDSQSTASLAADLQDGRTMVYLSGGAMPCLSLYKPYVLDAASIAFDAYSLIDEAEWHAHEAWVSTLAQKPVPTDFYAERDEIERRWHAEAATLSGADSRAFFNACKEEERRFYEKWAK